MGAILEILDTLMGKKQYPVIHLLPPPPEKRPISKGAQPKTQSSLFVIDEVRNEFGFHNDKDADRKGAVNWLTNIDKSILQDRELWGKTKQVEQQNIECKRLWATGESVDVSASKMGLSASWIEKRFASFSAALLQEGVGA